MRLKILFSAVVFILLSNVSSKGQTTNPAYRICGKWQSIEKNLTIQVYQLEGKILAKIIWFKSTGGKPMEYWKDIHNPDPALRDRNILGMSVVKNLVYQPDTNSWEEGMIYDAKHGREWNSAAYIDSKGILRVKGYWHFKFIGKTLEFVRLN